MKGVRSMKKRDLIVSILYILWGTANLLAALLMDTKLDGIFSGMAGAGIVPGVLMLIRYFYWKAPGHAQEYAARLESERIERYDELKEKIRGWTARYVYALSIVVTSVAMLVFGVLYSLDVAVDSYAVVLYLFCFLVLQWIAGAVIFKCLMKKYN